MIVDSNFNHIHHFFQFVCGRLFVLLDCATVHGCEVHSRIVDAWRWFFVHFCAFRAVWKRWGFAAMHRHDHSQQVNRSFNLLLNQLVQTFLLLQIHNDCTSQHIRKGLQEGLDLLDDYLLLGLLLRFPTSNTIQNLG
jgi:hypothetical protein